MRARQKWEGWLDSLVVTRTCQWPEETCGFRLTHQQYNHPTLAYGPHGSPLPMVCLRMNLDQSPGAHFSIAAAEPSRSVSTRVDMKTRVPHLPDHRVQVVEGGGAGFQAVAIVPIVSVTGTQSRNLAIWTNMCAFVAALPSAVVVSSRSRPVGMAQLLGEEGNARLRPIDSGWRLPSGSICPPVL
jgi:hypothetical protein